MKIACFGGSKCDELCYAAMKQVGLLLAQGGHTQINGAFGQALEASSEGAHEGDGNVIGYTMMGMPGNPHLNSLVDCREAYIRRGVQHEEELPIEIQFGVRLGNLLTADGFIVAAGPSTGTFIELLSVIAFNARPWKEHPKRLAILNPMGMRCPGWDGVMLEQLIGWGLLSREQGALIFIARKPESAVEWVAIRQ